MKYFSLFSGVGGFELAINNVYDFKKSRESRQVENGPDCSIVKRNVPYEQRASCVGFSEIDKYAVSVYQYHYPKHKNYGDITQIDWNTVPDFDLVVGGSPCQDLSVAGKQKGLSGERSGLFFEFVRCLKEKQPTNFIWENVKGALSSSSGWDFARVQIEFSEAGYDVEWQVLNAKDFGVPQNRERIFVVGHLRGKSEPKVFPIRTTNEMATREGDTQTANTLTSNYWKGPAASRPIVQVNNPTHSNDRVYSEDGISPSLNTMQGGRRQPKIEVVGNIYPISGHEAGNIYSRDGLSPTIKLNGPRPNKKNVSPKVFEGTRIRRLTPLECERLMSWPDNWTKEPNVSDTQRYKQCGNGLVSKVVEEIVRRLYL